MSDYREDPAEMERWHREQGDGFVNAIVAFWVGGLVLALVGVALWGLVMLMCD